MLWSSSAPRTLPTGAVVRAGDATHVWRVKDRVLQKVQVQLGERDARRGDYPVRSGLSAGDVILRAPGTTLADGQKVEFAAAAGASVPVVAKP